MRPLILALCFCLPAAAQDCPVVVKHVASYPGAVYIRYDATGKKIKATKWGLVHVDSVGDSHPDDFTLISNNGSRLFQSSPLIEAEQRLYGAGVGVYLIKAVFEDGSSWQDDGTHACRGLDKQAAQRLK